MKAASVLIGATVLGVSLGASIHLISGLNMETARFSIWRTVSTSAHGGNYIDAGDIRLYYETYGSGAPVVVLHGGLGSLEDMGHQIRALAATRFVVAADSRGHGRSTASNAPLSYALMAADIIKLLDALKIDRADVVGWSDGGIVGLELAMTNPQRVRRLVVIGANFKVEGLRDAPVPAATVPRPVRYYQGGATAGWPGLYQQVVRMWQTQPQYSLADLARIKAPTLVMAGESDVVRREHSDQLAKAIPDAQEFIIAGGTHFVQNDHPDVVNATILRFLE